MKITIPARKTIPAQSVRIPAVHIPEQIIELSAEMIPEYTFDVDAGVVSGVSAPAAQADFSAAVHAAFTADTTLDWRGGDVTLAATIVLDITSWRTGFGIRFNGAKVTNTSAGYAIHIRVPVTSGAVIKNVGMRNFVFSDGRFSGGAGALRMECRTNGSWIGLGNISNITCEGHTGYAFDLLGSVFEGKVEKCTTTNGQAFHARNCGLVEPDPNNTDKDKGLPSALYITDPDFRDGTGDSIVLSSSTQYQEPYDLTVINGYIVTNAGRAINAPAGLKRVEGTGVENNAGAEAIYCGYRGGVFKHVTGANPLAVASYPLIHAVLSNGIVTIEDCAIVNEGAGTGSKLAVIEGEGGTVFLNRSGTAADVTIKPIWNNSGPSAVLKIAQYT